MATRRIPRTYQRSSDQLVAAITTVPLCSALIPKQKPQTQSPSGDIADASNASASTQFFQSSMRPE